jgi:hypothetical protein
MAGEVKVAELNPVAKVLGLIFRNCVVYGELFDKLKSTKLAINSQPT